MVCESGVLLGPPGSEIFCHLSACANLGRPGRQVAALEALLHTSPISEVGDPIRPGKSAFGCWVGEIESKSTPFQRKPQVFCKQLVPSEVSQKQPTNQHSGAKHASKRSRVQEFKLAGKQASKQAGMQARQARQARQAKQSKAKQSSKHTNT